MATQGGEHYWFICQINLSDLREFQTSIRLPSTGLLSLFLTPYGGLHVAHFDESINLLPRAQKTSSYIAGQPHAIRFEQEVLFPDPTALLWCLNQDQWIRYMDFFKQLHLRPPITPFEFSRILVPRIEGYNQVDYAFGCLYDSVLEVSRRTYDQLQDGELSTWQLFAHLQIPSLRSQLIYTKVDRVGKFNHLDCYIRAGES